MGNLRVLKDDKGFWVVVRDVMRELGYSKQTHPERVIKSIPSEWKILRRVLTDGGAQPMWCISKEGLKYLCERCCRPLTETLSDVLSEGV
jgi:prophage antirepressor-like protein